MVQCSKAWQKEKINYDSSPRWEDTCLVSFYILPTRLEDRVLHERIFNFIFRIHSIYALFYFRFRIIFVPWLWWSTWLKGYNEKELWCCIAECRNSKVVSCLYCVFGAHQKFHLKVNWETRPPGKPWRLMSRNYTFTRTFTPHKHIRHASLSHRLLTQGGTYTDSHTLGVNESVNFAHYNPLKLTIFEFSRHTPSHNNSWYTNGRI